MKFYVKENGQFREATQDEILNPEVQLYDEKGVPLKRKSAPAVKKEDPIKELQGVIEDLAVAVKGVAGIKEKVEQLEKELAAYKEAAKKGFPIPSPEAGGKGADELQEIVGYDLAKQGRRLMDKFYHPSHVIDEETRKELARYFTLVVKAGVFQDPAARAKFSEVYGKTAIGDPGNEFPVPEVVEDEIIAFAREKSVVLQYASVRDMTSDKQSVPAEVESATAGWGSTTIESEPTVAEVELQAEELSAYSAVRNSTLQDARTDIVSWLTEALAEAAGLALDDEAFNGDGSNVCTGLLLGAGHTVQMETGKTNFSDLTADHLSEMIAKLDGVRKQGARFYMHGQVLHYVRTLKDSDGRPIFLNTIGDPVSGNIYGYPYTEVIKMPSESAANTPFIIFGNLKYFVVGRRLGTTTLQVDPYGLWTSNKTRFKLYQRWGMKIALPKAFVRLKTASS